MDFLREVTKEEFQKIKNADPSIPSPQIGCRYYWVIVTEEDFRKKIHIIVQGLHPVATWERFSANLCLEHYAQKVRDSNYQLPEKTRQEFPTFQPYFDEIKKRSVGFSREKMLLTPLCYKANKKTGPYMIRESVRRHISAYIHYFISEREKFESLDNAICMIPDNEQYQFPEVPNDFC